MRNLKKRERDSKGRVKGRELKTKKWKKVLKAEVGECQLMW